MTESAQYPTTAATGEALVICGDDGSVFAVPLALLEQCRVETSADDAVHGYLNPQPIPPGRGPGTYHAYGLAPVLVPRAVTSGERLGIIFVGGRG